MTHYQRLDVAPNASSKDIRLAYQRLLSSTNPQDTQALVAIEEAYTTLSIPINRAIYNGQLEAEAEGLERQRQRFPNQRSYRLWHDPNAFNHYDFINRLFDISEGSEDYLTPGQPLGRWDRNRLHWQLDTVATILHTESEGLKRVYKRNEDQQKRLDLLLRNEKKIGLCGTVLTGSHEKYLYDLFLGPVIVPQNTEMRKIVRLIGGWEQMNAYLRVNPHLDSANAVLTLYKAGCLNPANFSQFIASAENEYQLLHVASVITQLADENLLNPTNFDRLIAHSQFALSLCRGLSSLGSKELLTQQSFEVLLKAEQYAEVIGSGWKNLKEFNLLNQCNQEMIIQCAENNIDILISKKFLNLESQQLFTPEDGLNLLWTGETEALQTLSLHIDEMFAYGISLLCHDTDKAKTVFLLALDLKKSLKTHFSKPVEDQREAEPQFKSEFIQSLHSQDAAMSEHRGYWKVVIANIAIALTGVGLLALGVHYIKTGHCFFEQTKRQQIMNTIEESPWLQDSMITI